MHQDIIAPNPAYIASAPKIIQELGVPAIGTLAYKEDKVKKLFGGHDPQDPDFNGAVLYPHDANACDQRAIYIPDKDGWQGPGMWDHDGNKELVDLVGSGGWPFGNPEQNPPSPDGSGCGGGSGYHTIYNYEDAYINKNLNYKAGVTGLKINGVDYCYKDEKINFTNLNGN